MNKKMLHSVLVLAMLALTTVVGCSSDKVSFTTLEDARGTARANAEWNATKWRAASHADWDIV